MLNPHMNSWGLYEYYRQEAAPPRSAASHNQAR
jgi:hypothetical protein